jgi:dienelactone hydrolase
VIVFHEAFGVRAHVEDVTQRFTGAGHRAVTSHLFHRSGNPTINYSSVELVMPHMEVLSEEGFLSDLDATFDYLAGLPSRWCGVKLANGRQLASSASATRWRALFSLVRSDRAS